MLFPRFGGPSTASQDCRCGRSICDAPFVENGDSSIWGQTGHRNVRHSATSSNRRVLINKRSPTARSIHGLASPILEKRIADAFHLVESGETEPARQQFLKLAIGQPMPAEHRLLVAAGLEITSAPHLAMQVCDWIIREDASIAQAHYDMAFYAMRCGHPLYQAEALTRRAIEIDPHKVDYHIGLAMLLQKLDRIDEAVSTLLLIDRDAMHEASCARCLQHLSEIVCRNKHRELADSMRSRADRIHACVPNEMRPCPPIHTAANWEATPCKP